MVKVAIGVPTATLSSHNITIYDSNMVKQKIVIGVPTELVTAQ